VPFSSTDLWPVQTVMSASIWRQKPNVVDRAYRPIKEHVVINFR
jgi:hypothetical protein